LCWDDPVALGGERGWIAVDCEDASIWLSVDGTEWQALPDQDTIFGLYPSSEEARERLDAPVSLIGNDRTVLITPAWGWGFSVGWVGRFTENPPHHDEDRDRQPESTSGESSEEPGLPVGERDAGHAVEAIRAG
jgi:hypothetical protein